jgi:hypothetical protein
MSARAWLAAMCAVAIGRGAFAQQITVRAGVSVSPDTVRVGDPFRVTIGVRAPRGATIEFPTATDSASAVQSLDPVSIRTTADTTALEQYADYRVAAWDIGSQALRFEEVVVRLGRLERKVSVAGRTVFVKSVLPEDSTKRVPKPQRALFEFGLFPWWWLLVAAAIIGLGLLYWWWRRRRRRPPLALVVDPYERAEAEFTRIERLGLLDAGERGRYVALMTEVLRDYLAARYVEAALSNTSLELIRALHGQRFVPHDRLLRLLAEVDLVKFARKPISTERARELGREARAIVAHEHTASQPPAEQAAAA